MQHAESDNRKRGRFYASGSEHTLTVIPPRRCWQGHVMICGTYLVQASWPGNPWRS